MYLCFGSVKKRIFLDGNGKASFPRTQRREAVLSNRRVEPGEFPFRKEKKAASKPGQSGFERGVDLASRCWRFFIRHHVIQGKVWWCKGPSDQMGSIGNFKETE